MQTTLCSQCQKNVAVLFISKFENGKMVNRGLCLSCAKKLGLPQVDEIMKRMGINDDDDLEALSSELLASLNGGEELPDFSQQDGGDEPEEEAPSDTLF